MSEVDLQRCISCNTRLTHFDGPGAVSCLTCTVCGDGYLVCCACNYHEWVGAGDPMKSDSKGEPCVQCYRHFCIACWQNNGSIDGETGDFTCSDCVPKF